MGYYLRGIMPFLFACAVLCMGTLAKATDNHLKVDQRYSIHLNGGDSHDVQISSNISDNWIGLEFIVATGYQAKKRSAKTKVRYVSNVRTGTIKQIRIVSYSDIDTWPPLIHEKICPDNTDVAISDALEDPHLQNTRSDI